VQQRCKRTAHGLGRALRAWLNSTDRW
jgi:hypothetical protein